MTMKKAKSPPQDLADFLHQMDAERKKKYRQTTEKFFTEFFSPGHVPRWNYRQLLEIIDKFLKLLTTFWKLSLVFWKISGIISKMARAIGYNIFFFEEIKNYG